MSAPARVAPAAAEDRARDERLLALAIHAAAVRAQLAQPLAPGEREGYLSLLEHLERARAALEQQVRAEELARPWWRRWWAAGYARE